MAGVLHANCDITNRRIVASKGFRHGKLYSAVSTWRQGVPVLVPDVVELVVEPLSVPVEALLGSDVSVIEAAAAVALVSDDVISAEVAMDGASSAQRPHVTSHKRAPSQVGQRTRRSSAKWCCSSLGRRRTRITRQRLPQWR